MSVLGFLALLSYKKYFDFKCVLIKILAARKFVGQGVSYMLACIFETGFPEVPF